MRVLAVAIRHPSPGPKLDPLVLYTTVQGHYVPTTLYCTAQYYP